MTGIRVWQKLKDKIKEDASRINWSCGIYNKEYCMFQYFFVNSVLYIINFMSMHIYTHFVFLESWLLNIFAGTPLHKLECCNIPANGTYIGNVGSDRMVI